MTPYIAQFWEYDLSSHAQLTKNADKREDSPSKSERTARIFLLLFSAPTIRRVAKSAMNKTATGINMGLFGLQVTNAGFRR